MGDAVFNAVGGKFTLDRLFAAAGAVMVGIAALNHKAVDDPVKGQSIVEALVGKIKEVLNRNRSGISVQFDRNSSPILDVDFNMMGADLFASASRQAGNRRYNAERRCKNFSYLHYFLPFFHKKDS